MFLNGKRIEQDKWSEVKVKDQLCFGTPISNNSFRYILEQLTDEDYQLVQEELIAEELSGGIKKKSGETGAADASETGVIVVCDKDEPTHGKNVSEKIDPEKSDEAAGVLSANENQRDEMLSAMQEEFLCVICQELFVKAHSLSCSHSYCKQCITDWMKKNKFCPMCRKTIEGKPVPSIAMDNAIDKLVACLPEEAQKERTELLKERSSTKQKQDVILISDSPVRPGPSGAVTRNASRRRNITVNLETSDSDSDSNSDSNSSSQSNSDFDDDPGRYEDMYFYDSDGDSSIPGYTGLPGYSWGGYGHCYRCGKRFNHA